MGTATTHAEGAPDAGASQGRPARCFAATPRVVAWLTARERGQVQLGSGGRMTLTHRDALAEVGGDLARGTADAVLVSAARLTNAERPTLAAYVRGFPAVAFAGIVTAAADDRHALAAAHLLGEAGVSALLDCRVPGGWTALRGTFAPRRRSDAFRRACVSSVLADVWGGGAVGRAEDGMMGAGLARFFALAFAPGETRARHVAARLGVCPPTLASRFFRAGLPSPKRYVDGARLVWAAHLGEAPGLTVQAIAEQLDVSAPQALARSVRRLTGQSVGTFRRAHTGSSMLARFRAELVTPYREQLRAFDPLGATTGEPHPADRTPALRCPRAA
jgi:AraC-like DNA-binding protein